MSSKTARHILLEYHNRRRGRCYDAAADNAINAPCRTWHPFETVARNTDIQTWLRWPSAEPNLNQTRIWCCPRRRTCEINHEIIRLKCGALQG